IGILAPVNGEAAIDITGTGAAATSTQLSNLGFTSEEVATLATTYAQGQSIWRVPVTHFSDYDFNQGSGPLPGSPIPGAGQDAGPTGPQPPPMCPVPTEGCTIYT